ncbi:MAG: glucosaminidase domain-containing protein [Acidimicrobiia bacterium]
MVTHVAAPSRRRPVVLIAVALIGIVVLAACRPSPPPPPPAPAPSGTVPVMGAASVGAAQLVNWFLNRQPQPAGTYNATVPIDTLAALYIEEGAAEGVKGDVAFVQAIVETGWFRFGGSVPAWMNNFAGIGATDTNPAPASFPDARTGVRAQIQHLRAYADAGATSCTIPPLHNPCVDPRFNLVVPKGKAPTWNQMGNGNWATSTTYASSILGLYNQALTFG